MAQPKKTTSKNTSKTTKTRSDNVFVLLSILLALSIVFLGVIIWHYA